MGDEIGLVDAELVEHAGDVLRLGLLVVAGGRMGRQAHAAQVGHDHSTSADQCRRQRRPHVTSVGKAVQHDDGRSRTADAGVDRDAGGLDLFDAHAGWEGLNHT